MGQGDMETAVSPPALVPGAMLCCVGAPTGDMGQLWDILGSPRCHPAAMGCAPQPCSSPHPSLGPARPLGCWAVPGTKSPKLFRMGWGGK